jgi:hypothetical protein
MYRSKKDYFNFKEKMNMKFTFFVKISKKSYFQGLQAFHSLNYKTDTYLRHIIEESENADKKKNGLKEWINPLSQIKSFLARVLRLDLGNAACKDYVEKWLSSTAHVPTLDSSPLKKEIEGMLKQKSWANKIPKPDQGEERDNVIQHILFKAGIQLTKKDFKQEYDCLIILPSSRLIIGEILI